MNGCIRPCSLFSILLLMLAIGLCIWLGDIRHLNAYNLSNVGVQFGSILFGIFCIIFHIIFFITNGYFVFGSSNSYLFVILLTLIVFAAFTICFMFSYVWMAKRVLDVGLFLVADALQAAFIGLSLFSQKAAYDQFVLNAMKLNTKSGNPIDSRTATRLFRLKYGRLARNPMFSDSELERLRSYMIPESDDDEVEKQLERMDIAYDPKHDPKHADYCYSAPLVAL